MMDRQLNKKCPFNGFNDCIREKCAIWVIIPWGNNANGIIPGKCGLIVGEYIDGEYIPQQKLSEGPCD